MILGLIVGPLLCSTPVAAQVPSVPGNMPPAELRRVVVDAADRIGTLRPLQGVNGAPGKGLHKPEKFVFGGWNIPSDWDATAGYRRARISLVRTHDSYGPGDIDARFGSESDGPEAIIPHARSHLSIFRDPDADPRDPKSYNFGPTDRLIASIRNAGAEVIFRLGRSEGSDVEPPKDLDRYAEVVKHIVLHYNHGWANGFHYGIRYWEVWNEPDLGRTFWGGTPQLFFDMYGKIASAVKQADPHAQVGGPAIARPNDDNPYIDDFLDYVRAHDLPLDFYSWHWYATDSNDPLDVVRVSRAMRARLDAHGFRSTQSVLDEWNYGLVGPLPSDLQRASFVTSARIYMQDAPIDLSALYRADNVFGKDGTTPDKTGQALIALGRMQDTPQRLAVRGADTDGFAVQAGRSADGRTLQVLISNYEIPEQYRGPRDGPDVLRVGTAFHVKLLARRNISYRDNAGYDLKVEHLSPGAAWSVERYRISESSDFSLVDRTVHEGPTIRLHAALPPPGIELVVLKKTR